MRALAVGFPDENRDDRKGDDEHQRGKRHVAGTPPVRINDGAGELRHQRGANPDPGHRDAKREAAALVEPRRHGLGVRQRRLPRAEQSDKAGHRDEHGRQGRGQRQRGQRQREEHDGRQRDPANPVTIDGAAEKGIRRRRTSVADEQ